MIILSPALKLSVPDNVVSLWAVRVFFVVSNEFDRPYLRYGPVFRPVVATPETPI